MRISEQVVSALVEDVLLQLPTEIIDFYRKVPGRKPLQRMLQIQSIYNSLGADAAKILLEDAVDRTTISILYLIDRKFKNFKIDTKFLAENFEEESAGSLFEFYRMRVQPGGELTA